MTDLSGTDSPTPDPMWYSGSFRIFNKIMSWASMLHIGKFPKLKHLWSLVLQIGDELVP